LNESNESILEEVDTSCLEYYKTCDHVVPVNNQEKTFSKESNTSQIVPNTNTSYLHMVCSQQVSRSQMLTSKNQDGVCTCVFL